MIDITEAIEKARKFVVELYDETDKILLEGFSLSADRKSWNITYSFWRKNETPNQLQAALGITGSKTYKIIEIDGESGEVVGMKAGSTAESAV